MRETTWIVKIQKYNKLSEKDSREVGTFGFYCLCTRDRANLN